MIKALTLLCIVIVGNAKKDHPINDDFVNEIKNKTNKWKPYDTKENPLKDLSH